jgi:hypothetical protein
MAHPFRLVAIVTLFVASATIAGCSCSVWAGSPPAEKANTTGVEQQIFAELASLSGEPPVSVECPDEMLIEEGKRYQCEVTHPRTGPQAVDVTMHGDGRVTWFVP